MRIITVHGGQTGAKHGDIAHRTSRRKTNHYGKAADVAASRTSSLRSSDVLRMKTLYKLIYNMIQTTLPKVPANSKQHDTCVPCPESPTQATQSSTCGHSLLHHSLRQF